MSNSITYALLQTMPDHLRASHRAAGNWGAYPDNGAVRTWLPLDEAEAIVEADADRDGYDSIVRVMDAPDRSPAGDIEWEAVASYVACCYGPDGDEPGDCSVRIGEDEIGRWWIDDGDDTDRVDIHGPFATREAAEEAAEALAEEMGEGLPGEDAEDVATRLLDEAVEEEDADGDYGVRYSEYSTPDERYATVDQAAAACRRAQRGLEKSNPGTQLLSYYEVVERVDGEWVSVETDEL